jgi:hypothetical protein
MPTGAPPGPWERDFESAGELPRERTRSWLWRLLYILYSLEVGIFLVFLPWLTIWDNNYLLYRYPDVRPVLSNAFLKGAVLGLGLVNIVIGIQEIGLFRRRSTRSLRPPGA